jgi:UDP-glucose 4-epimerase
MVSMRSLDSTVLVTGGLGYIGNYAVRELLERGWRVRILDNRYRSDPAVAENLAALDGVDIVEGDVRYAHTVESAVTGTEAVVHLAAVCINKSVSDPTESLDVNLMGTQNVLAAAAREGVRRFVFASSASVYGNPTALPMREDDQLSPLTPYCVAKSAGEQMLDYYARRSRMSWAALRFFNVYGPGQPVDAYYTSVIVTFLRRLAAGLPPIIDGKGDQSMDFVHVEDVARAIGVALDSELPNCALNIGTGRQTSIAELADLLIGTMGVDVEPVFKPREVLVARREASMERTLATLDWSPRISLEEGVATLADWLKRRDADRTVAQVS